MNAAQERKFITEAEYLAYCDEHPQERFELIDGDIVAMAGASLNHNMISMNLGAKFHNHLLESECSVFGMVGKKKSETGFGKCSKRNRYRPYCACQYSAGN